LLAKVIDKGVLTGDKDYIIKMLFVLIGIVFLGLCCALVCQYLASRVSQGYGTVLRNEMFSHISKFSESQINSFSHSSLINRTTTDVNRIQNFIAMLIRLVIRAPFLCIGGIIMSFIIDKRLALIIIMLLPVFILIMVFIMRKSIPLHNKVQNKLDKITKKLNENITGTRVIRAFARSEEEKTTFKSLSKEHMDANFNVRKITILLNPLTTLIMNLAIVLILLISGIELKNNLGVSTGEIVAFINYVNQILAALIVVANLVVMLTKSYSSAQRIIEVLETKPELNYGDINIKNIESENIIEFKNVNFSYSNDHPTLENISLIIKKNSKIGIIGGTGSGKSTLVNLILNIYTPQSGEIFLKGVNLNKISIESLRDTISVVPQKVELFSGTIRENIAFGCIAEDNEIIYAVQNACADNFIQNKTNKYNEIVQKKGSNFSGGQKQRIAIARALLKDSDILIMDDSSSALDYSTDLQIRKNINNNYKNKTLIVVSQKVKSIMDYDQIIVIDNGIIAGIGTHSELIKTNKLYKEICISQELEVLHE
ncbi:ABC transporter ATP-binding protein/permease, partial [Eubacteriales bacterium OttesenSCG-928-G02]|nr:ABC transporter ATP-binding protein/permease [Eubacteriales bacterium OttesenSCG-928-G02]